MLKSEASQGCMIRIIYYILIGIFHLTWAMKIVFNFQKSPNTTITLFKKILIPNISILLYDTAQELILKYGYFYK